MRIGVLTPRRSSWVLSGPIAYAAQRMGHHVTLVDDSSQQKIGDTWVWGDEVRGTWVSHYASQPLAFEGDWLIGTPPVPDHPTARRCSIEAWFDQIARPELEDPTCDFTHRTLLHGLISTSSLKHIPSSNAQSIVWMLPKSSLARLPAVTLLAIALRRLASR